MALIETVYSRFRKIRGVNATDTSLPAPTIATTRPVGRGTNVAQATSRGCLDLALAEGQPSQNEAVILIYGTGADDATGKARIYGISPVEDENTDTVQWVPVLLASVSFVLSTAVGASGRAIGSSERFADTITLDVGAEGGHVHVISPTGNVPAHIKLNTEGHAILEMAFSTESSSTGCNALVKLL
jgi:hypothetical protein